MDHAHSLIHVPAQRSPAVPPTARLAATIDLWRRRRRSRREMMALDESMLNDIGLTRSQVEHEAAKPFWRG